MAPSLLNSLIIGLNTKISFLGLRKPRSTEVAGSPMFMLYSKLKAVKTKLKRVNKDLYGCISQKILLTRQKLESVQLRLLQKNSEVGLRTLEQECLHEFSAAQKAEESFLKQKSHNKWLNLGDQNSRFFHFQVKARQARNAIKCLMDSEGNSDKAPGPDGFTACFFKKSWPIVGSDVCKAVQSFFQSGALLKEVNSTIITLVPKVPNPSSITEYRPIACWRVISENILLAQELVKGYHKNKGKARCAIKVDLKKAYDSVEWNFILMSLLAVGCPAQFVTWVRECITTPRFSIALNGSLVGYFKGEKGLRQGDPLSPYLFVLAMEVFTKLLHNKVADIPSIKLIKEGLEEFRMLSGLSVNQSKSEVFCANVPSDLQAQILSILQFRAGKLPVRYLGMPLISGKLSYDDCVPLIEKITARINSWTVRHLSFSGRLQFIQSVLNSIQLFWSSIFILPKKVVKAIEQRFNQFLWEGQEGGRGGFKVSWEQKFLVGKASSRLFLGVEKVVEAKVYGHRTVYDAASSINAKVKSVLHNNEWCWKPARSEDLVDIQSKLSMDDWHLLVDWGIQFLKGKSFSSFPLQGGLVGYGLSPLAPQKLYSA
uniref:Reverse transcriptase domain-containing protein n=1 Tax=Fagus sylvatica TaxID=28930 RepID=A0A2N9FAP0_FAGSY